MNLAKIKRAINHQFRRQINQRNQQSLQNQGFSLLSSNCTGGLILHDLAQPFLSPFVNLYITPKDFIRYLQNIEYYQQAKLQFIEPKRPYPVALLEEITLHFMHYTSPEQAEQKWQERTKRINLNNVFIMMTDRDGCDYTDLLAFEQLPFANKVVFTHRPYPELSSTYYIRGFEKQGQVGDLFAYTGWFGHKYYDQFDYINWFNQRNKS
ncbi:uncharacterized protein (DUF1919 family) [Volucribacter psittacicida]|uniref:Uncharacterized protein (DUF1919 family) n=1 Tax=Volucribacter psittacicida TaxID=203482 RepID=A0A4R1G4G2_9PAST|nr:DUF1919 domain-containing protein [Volucribacter psittacicida]TCK01621.1 uncharacterized protein (DUF1919 family) [Volucribacter psittacicida]